LGLRRGGEVRRRHEPAPAAPPVDPRAAAALRIDVEPPCVLVISPEGAPAGTGGLAAENIGIRDVQVQARNGDIVVVLKASAMASERLR